jgi:benzoyl-CoA reductase/2-hydroxyglutaryl-CoA dehydratase subunit BcrC/BadD/HgdB
MEQKDLTLRLENRRAQLRAAAKKGTKIVGYFPGNYVPEEIIYASGTVPICLSSVSSQHANAALDEVPDIICPFARAQIGQRLLKTDEYYMETVTPILMKKSRQADPYKIIAQTLQRSLSQVVSARAAIIIEACKRLAVGGVLCRYHVGCRNLVADAIILRNEIVKQLDPVLLIEWESFDPRIYNEGGLRTQLQAFKEIMKERR